MKEAYIFLGVLFLFILRANNPDRHDLNKIYRVRDVWRTWVSTSSFTIYERIY